MAISQSKRLSTDAFCPAHCFRQVTMSFTPAGGPQSVTEVVGPILVISTLSCQKNLPLKIWHEALIMKNIYRFRRGSRTFHQWVILFAGEGCPSLLLVLLIFQKFLGGIGSGQRRLINKNTWIMEREIYCSYITDFYLYFFFVYRTYLRCCD